MFGALVSLASMPVLFAVSASATEVTRNTNFRVNVSDALSVSVITPDQWAVGDPDEFLRNRIIVSANTNCVAGLTASMYTKTDNTNLVNTRKSTYTIPTLETTTTLSGETPGASFPANYWGYSLNDAVSAPIANASYGPLGDPSHPVLILHTSGPGSAGPQDVFFGAKADMTKASGTYQSTVVISVVTGVIENDPTDPDYNPVVPENPATPTTPDTPTYTPTPAPGYTTYTTVTPNQDNTTTTTTEVSNGDTRSSYQAPHGVNNRTSTSTEVSEGSALATGLAVTAAVAGATGFIFFLIGKRRKDEEEEEDTGEQQPPVQQ